MKKRDKFDKNNAQVRRMTKQRRIILEELKKISSHPGADDIFRLVRTKIPRISFGTVYRNLKVLKEQGLLLELDYSRGFSRFDANVQNHYHFRCLQCERVFDVEEPVRRDFEQRVAQKMGFQVSYHRLEFYGKCNNC